MATTMDIKYGVSATFNSAKDIYEAAGKVREEGYQNWECYTPIPVHGLDAQMGVGRSKVPCFTLLGGVTGFFYWDADRLVYECLRLPAHCWR